MSLLRQRESDMHFNANTLSVNGEAMWSGLGGCSPLGGGLILLVTWASCNSPLMIYRKQRNQQVHPWSFRGRIAKKVCLFLIFCVHQPVDGLSSSLWRVETIISVLLLKWQPWFFFFSCLNESSMPDERLSNLKWPLFYLDGFISYLLNCGLIYFYFFYC